ncbi:hypothetical protein LEMLEM_LOCUS23978, partial [Lemmus lemmus]
MDVSRRVPPSYPCLVMGKSPCLTKWMCLLSQPQCMCAHTCKPQCKCQ